MKDFTKLLKISNEDTFYEDIFLISSNLIYSRIQANRVVFNYGNTGNTFYVILKGKVCVLVPQAIRVMMTETEYISHLERLKKLGEDELVNNCISANFSCFNNVDYSRFQSKKDSRFSSPINKLNNLKNKSQRKSRFIKTNDLNKDDYKDYIEKRKAVFFDVRQSMKVEVKIFEYQLLLELNKGQYFGDYALENKSVKRNATIITTEETHFGLIEREVYDKVIKLEAQKIFRMNVIMLLKTNIFQNLDHHRMENYFRYFVLKSYLLNDILIKANSEVLNEIYFIKSGEFEMVMKKSLLELNELIHFLKGKTRYEFEILSRAQKFNAYLKEKRTFRFSIIKNGEFVGLDDIFLKEKSLFSIRCISLNSEVFSLKKEFLSHIFEKEKNLKEIFNDHVATKKNYLLERLISLLELKISDFLKNHDELSIEIKPKNQQTENHTNNFQIFKKINTENKIKSLQSLLIPVQTNFKEKIKVVPSLKIPDKNPDDQKFLSSSDRIITKKIKEIQVKKKLSRNIRNEEEDVIGIYSSIKNTTPKNEFNKSKTNSFNDLGKLKKEQKLANLIDCQSKCSDKYLLKPHMRTYSCLSNVLSNLSDQVSERMISTSSNFRKLRASDHNSISSIDKTSRQIHFEKIMKINKHFFKKKVIDRFFGKKMVKVYEKDDDKNNLKFCISSVNFFKKINL